LNETLEKSERPRSKTAESSQEAKFVLGQKENGRPEIESG